MKLAARRSSSAPRLVRWTEISADVAPALPRCFATCYLSKLRRRSTSSKCRPTLAFLLARLRVPDAGLILLRGLDQNTLGLERWRSRSSFNTEYRSGFYQVQLRTKPRMKHALGRVSSEPRRPVAQYGHKFFRSRTNDAGEASPALGEAFRTLVSMSWVSLANYGSMKCGKPVCAVNPPSTTIVAPVTKDASSEARKRTAFAISSGSPMRPVGF